MRYFFYLQVYLLASFGFFALFYYFYLTNLAIVLLFLQKSILIVFKCNVRCSAVTTALIAFIIIMLPALDLSVGLLGIIFGISGFGAALNGLREFIKLQQQGISIKPIQKISTWFGLIGGALFIIAGLLVYMSVFGWRGAG